MFAQFKSDTNNNFDFEFFQIKNTNENIQSLKKNNEKSGSKSRNKTVERRIVDF